MSSTYSYTIPTVAGTQVKYYTATSNNEKLGVLSTSNTGFSIVNVPAGTSNYVLNYNGSNGSLSFIDQTAVSTDTDVPKINETTGALYMQNNGENTWQPFNAGILVSYTSTSTVAGITATNVGNYMINYDGSNYSLATYTVADVTYPSGILVGSNGYELTGITTSNNGDYVIRYSDGTYSLKENSSPTYQKGILVGDGSSTLKYMTGEAGDFSSTEPNYYIIKATTTTPNTAPSTYSLSVVPLNGLLYTNSEEGINSVNISTNGNYVLKYSNNNLSALTLPATSSGIIIYDAAESVYECINAQSGTYYLKGVQRSGRWFFTLENAYVNNYNGINYAANGTNYVPNVMRFKELEDADSSACYIIKASTQSIPDQGRALTLAAQIINSGIMYGTSDHNVKYASVSGKINTDDQYVIKFNNDQSLFLSSFTATATVSVPTSGILVGGANNVIGKIAPLTNVNDTFVINFASGTTGVDDGTYSLTSLNTLLPTITTSFGSPFSFNLARLQQSATVFVTLTNKNYFCSTQVSIPTYALKTNLVQTRVDVEGIYRVNFDATTTTLKVDTKFSSSLAFPNQNMVDLTFVLAFNDNYVYAGAEKFNDNSLAKIGEWTGVYETWDDSGYDFKLNTTKNDESFIITGNQNVGSEQISLTSNISAIPITNSPPFEYRYFKTSLYFTAGNFTNFDAVDSDTPKLYIFYGYTIEEPSLANGVSIANVNITVYSSAIPSLPVP